MLLANKPFATTSHVTTYVRECFPPARCNPMRAQQHAVCATLRVHTSIRSYCMLLGSALRLLTSCHPCCCCRPCHAACTAAGAAAQLACLLPCCLSPQ